MVASLALSGLAALAPAARADDLPPPDSPVGKAFAEWLKVVRKGESEEMKKHYEATFTEAFRKQVRWPTYEVLMGTATGPLRIAEIKRYEGGQDYGMVVHAVTSKGEWLKMSISVESVKPHLIDGLLLQPGTAPVNDDDAFKSFTDLKDLLTKLCKLHGVPAIAAAHVKGDKVVDVAVVGVRRHGSQEAVEPGDLFHIGSVTKSVTATMVGRLIEEGKLDWDITLAKALPDMKMHDAYREVTLTQLMQHRGGITPALTFDQEQLDRLTALGGSPTEQRKAFLADILMMPPVHTPGTKSEYSNAGYALVGYIAEVAAGKPWAQLVREYVFEPMGLKSAGFGWPATHERPYQPHGHGGSGDAIQVQPIGEYELGEFLAPAGDVNMSVNDLARYAAYHLAGLRGKDGPLKAATIKRLHTPAPGDDYAGGWVVAEFEGKPMHWHNGSAGTFYTLVSLLPESDQAIVVMMNQADEVEALARRIAEAAARK